jgi:hypothetical protein
MLKKRDAGEIVNRMLIHCTVFYSKWHVLQPIDFSSGRKLGARCSKIICYGPENMPDMNHGVGCVSSRHVICGSDLAHRSPRLQPTYHSSASGGTINQANTEKFSAQLFKVCQDPRMCIAAFGPRYSGPLTVLFRPNSLSIE